MDLISVVVPIYKVEEYLDRCIQSIIDQTYENLEIILVDDGSPDNCPTICDAWAKKDRRIQVIHKENGGLSSARNTGMKVLTGKYVCFIDSDDYIELDMIETMHNSILKDDFDVCVCNTYNIDQNGNIFARGGNYKDSVHYGSGVLESFVKGVDFDSYSVCDKMYKVSVLKNIGLFFDEKNKWGEDFPFNYMFFSCAESCISLSTSLYNYRIGRNGSITTGISFGNVMRWQNNYKVILNEIKEGSVLYQIAMEKHLDLVLCCIRELLASNDKKLIEKCYPLMVNEIKIYGTEYFKIKGKSLIIRLSALLIQRAPSTFKCFYTVYKKYFAKK